MRVPTGMAPDCWWFGFDCGHAYEYCPMMEAGTRLMAALTGIHPPESLRKWPATYVTAEECRIRTEALAVVLKAAAESPEALAGVFDSST